MTQGKDTAPPLGREKPKKMGRPPLPPEQRRTGRVEVFLSPAERADLMASAKAAGLPLPNYIRTASLRRRIQPLPPVADAELSRALVNIGNLFSGLAKQARAGVVTAVDPASLDEMHTLLDALADALLGQGRNGYDRRPE